MKSLGQCRLGASLDPKANLCFLDTKMGLSDILQIRKLPLHPFSFNVITEETANDMDIDSNSDCSTDSSSSLDKVRIEINDNSSAGLSKANLKHNEDNNNNNNNSNNLENTNSCDTNEDDLFLNAHGRSDGVFDKHSTTPKSSRRLTMCRRKLSHLSTCPLLSSSSSSSSSSSTCSSPLSSVSSPTPLRCEDLLSPHEEQQQLILNRHNSEVKSGNLVLILHDQNPASLPSSPRLSPRICDKSMVTSSRCPVMVKIHKRSYERYAIVSRTRRHQTMPSFYLKLKHSHVSQSASNPCHFDVVVDGADAKSYKFEASSPQAAQEWIQAFSNDTSAFRKMSPHHHKRSNKDNKISQHKLLADTLEEDVIIEEEPNVTSPEPAKEDHTMVPSKSSNFLTSTPISSPKISRSPALPILSESLDESDEE